MKVNLQQRPDLDEPDDNEYYWDDDLEMWIIEDEDEDEDED